MAIQIKWFPPSWFQIKTSTQIIYIDPAYLRSYFIHYPKRIDYSTWPNPIDGLPEALEPADMILVTHHHRDHVKQITVNRLRHSRTRVIAPRRCIKELGKTIELIAPGEEIAAENIKIKAVDAYNTQSSRATKKVHHQGDGVGYVLNVAGKTIYHAGDTDLIPEMKTLGKIEVSLLPIGGTFTMNPSEALAAALLIAPRVVIPMHRLQADPHEFKRKLEAQSDIKVVPLQIGEVYCPA